MATPYLPTEQAVAQSSPEVLGIERQRKLADLLTAQAFTQPQGQMISGHYVAPSWTQQLAPLASALAGSAVSERADVKQQELAKALRAKQVQEIATFEQMEKEKPGSGISYALASDNPILRDIAKKQMEGYTLKEGEVRKTRSISGELTEEKGLPKLHSVDGNLVDSQGNVLFRAPKVFAPHAPQMIATDNGFVTYNPNTGVVTPVVQPGANGQPGAPLMPPASAHIQNERTATNQQTAIMNDAIKGVENNRQYFGSKYAAPEVLGGEFGTAQMNKRLPESAVAARSKVFNTASAVIKERAGTAQSASERADIMRFLPSKFDDDATIIGKLNAYNQYIASKAEGTTSVKGAVTPYQGQAKPNAPTAPAATSNAPLEFKSEADAAKAGLKKGTRVVINGVAGTWE